MTKHACQVRHALLECQVSSLYDHRMSRAAIYGRQSHSKEKSISEQVALCTADAMDQGWTVACTYRDKTSASRYRVREREEWPLVVAAVQAREFDVLVLWSSSRGDRDLTSWSGLLDAARKHGVLIRVTDDERTYDVRKAGDWQALAQQGVGNAVDSDKISAAVRRGLAGAAAAGRPHGRTIFGYRRVYDPTTGEFVRQEPEPTLAAIVREIIERVARSEPISKIADDLEARDVPRPLNGRWHRARVRDIATNPAYIGKRVHKGVESDGTWPPLVEPATFYAAVRVLSDPARVTSRPGRQKHLLSYLALCAECGGPLCSVTGRYRCLRGCVSIAQTPADQLVTEAILARLVDPSIYKRLRQAGDDADQLAIAAWADVAELTATLDEWRRSAARGQTTPESLAVIEPDLTRRIRAAQRRAERAAVPPALREVLEPGADVSTRWEALQLPARREVIRRLVHQLRVSKSESPGHRTFDPTRFDTSVWRGDRLTWGQRRTM